MAYGLKYQAAFTSDRGLNCVLQISAKEYDGDEIDITLTGTPVVHSWNTDEAKPAIKGSGLDINILNRGILPITDFIANEDDFFHVVFRVNGNIQFEGYLVQDDYSEILVDYPHEINLKATDNLGLLKDIPLGEAAITYGVSVTDTYTILQTASNKIKITGDIPVKANQVLDIDSGTALDGRYSIKAWQHLAGPFTEVTLTSDLNGTVVPPTSADITFIDPVDLSQRMLLSDLLYLCFKSTNLSLRFHVYGTIYPDGAEHNRLFDDVMIAPESFLSGDKWASCYEVIEKIIGRCGFTLLQANGFWNLVRWDELRLSGNEIPGSTYDEQFVYLGIISLFNEFTTGFEQDTFPEEGLSYTIQRPLKYSQETFNYRNPENLIRNINFTDVGELLSVTTVGTDTVYDYAMVGWEQGFEWTTGGGGYIGSAAQRIIRVIIDIDGNERDRFGVIKGNTGFDDYAAAQSNGVELRVGDRIKYSFDFKTTTQQPNAYFRVNLLTTINPVPRSVNNRYVANDGRWVTAGPLLSFNTTGSSLVWNGVSVESEPIPYDGLVIVKLAQVVVPSSSTKETHYKNIRFEVIREISGRLKIIGHQHTSSQLLNIKNKQEAEIYVDSSPSNAIAGTLFLETFTGPVRDLVTTWRYAGVNYDKLGHITTRDELFWRRVSRLKLEGTLYQLIQNDICLSALSVCTYAQFTGSNFIFGKLSIDYRRDKAICTLFEMYNDSEADADLKEIYGFKYLYEKS